MSHNDAAPTGADLLIDRLKTLITTLIPNSQSGGAAQLNTAVLAIAEQQLKDMLPMLQFELMDAEDAGNWEQVDRLSQAVNECKTALNAVRAASLRATVIGLDDQDLAEMRQIRQQIEAAAKTKRWLETFLQTVNFLRRLASRVAGF
jgi:hypothetical protein